jgi:hypothetical protein
MEPITWTEGSCRLQLMRYKAGPCTVSVSREQPASRTKPHTRRVMHASWLAAPQPKCVSLKPSSQCVLRSAISDLLACVCQCVAVGDQSAGSRRACFWRQRAAWSLAAAPSTSGRQAARASASGSASQIKPAYNKYKCVRPAVASLLTAPLACCHKVAGGDAQAAAL